MSEMTLRHILDIFYARNATINVQSLQGLDYLSDQPFKALSLCCLIHIFLSQNNYWNLKTEKMFLKDSPHHRKNY